MFRRTVPALGRPFKFRDGYQVIHAAQRPAAPAHIDFNALGLQFEMTHTPDVKVTRHYWSPKPLVAPVLPFAVDRANGDALPVYTDYKHGRTKVVTIVRKVRGDIDVMVEEIGKVCERAPMTVRAGKIVIDGNYHRRLKVWLTGLGF
jgi:large subunit ribosomal protein L49